MAASDQQYIYRVDYKTKSGDWQPYFLADSPDVAKAYLAIFEPDLSKWFYIHDVEMARSRRFDGTIETLRITRNSVVTMKEVDEIRGRKAARARAEASVKAELEAREATAS